MTAIWIHPKGIRICNLDEEASARLSLHGSLNLSNPQVFSKLASAGGVSTLVLVGSDASFSTCVVHCISVHVAYIVKHDFRIFQLMELIICSMICPKSRGWFAFDFYLVDGRLR